MLDNCPVFPTVNTTTLDTANSNITSATRVYQESVLITCAKNHFINAR